ncbi:MAG: GNAT family N-acetyltransferase [Acidimicrobiales bacterium]
MAERSGLSVEEVDPRRLHDLRRRVLRGGDPAAAVDEPRDTEATTLHLAGVLDGVVVVCASFYATPHAPEPAPAYQLRFMAADPAVRGRGFGARVLDEAERRLAARGVVRLWANARDSALGFYQSVGWTVVAGTHFVSVETGLPHTVIDKPLVAGWAKPGSPPPRH